ncbi:hypothetical protein FH972_000320 [Carpinus fangiana]|uniref:DUF4220 domain-containing protein n=1 Tax=Carpinus fangiana TaxID=176857 RepID=A0A5N6QA96_9ROSI|nr:hypothetical protein FH972_000320 [Carpinus fangiana]
MSILSSTTKFYDKWNVRGFVLFSLFLQTILILFAPFRKRTRCGFVIFSIWIAYLVADWAANFAVGLISNSQKDIRQNRALPNYDHNAAEHAADHADILAFWAPFLLLHLGGPDTITAFALEDNALWLRHLVGLISQVSAAFLVFNQSFPRNRLWMPTVLLFAAGIIKYVERTCALFLANLDKFRKSKLKKADPGPNYAKIMEEYASKKEAKLPARIELIREPNKESKIARYAAVDEGPLDDVKVVRHAYHFFNIFNGLIVDLIFSFHERDESRMFFNKRTPDDAFKVIAVELNFIYELLYTKVLVVHSKPGYFVRFVSWCVVVASLSIFYTIEKRGFGKVDVGITYSLLFGAIALDTIALLMLAFSDWTVASIPQNSPICLEAINRCFLSLLRHYLKLKRINWWKKKPSCWDRARQVLLRRWSESLNQYNLIHYCLKERPKKKRGPFDRSCRILIDLFEKCGFLKDFYDNFYYVSSKPFEEKLWEFIFFQIKKKSDLADEPETAKSIRSARGGWVLQNTEWTIIESSSRKLMHYIVDVDFDQSLILWHIATDLCYHTKDNQSDTTDNQSDEDTSNRREFCKILSDYMLYLLIMQPTMMSAVAGIGEIRFRDTCAEAKEFFDRKELPKGPKEEIKKVACEMILEVNTDVEPVAVKGDRSKSVMFDACILAKELRNLETKKRWGLMSEMWVELLSYAASHCRANTHAAQLSKGGQLITFVWLLMAHFGIGEQFQINEGQARAKLIVDK